MNWNHPFLQFINLLPAMDMAKLKYISCHTSWECIFPVFSFCKMYQLVFMLFITEWPQEQISLDDTHVWVESSIRQPKQGIINFEYL